MRKILFEDKALEQFVEWAAIDKKIFKRIAELLKEIQKTPFEGKGKPEALKHNLRGYWSRRIDEEHRLVYEVKSDVILVISCKFHY